MPIRLVTELGQSCDIPLTDIPITQAAQNVIIELQYKSPTGKINGASPQRSCFLGWTGMPSKRKLAPVVGREGMSGGFSREQEISTVELDTTFGRLLGLTEGQKV
jgi:peroxin-1